MANSNLFTPLKVGRLQLAHRIALAPLTRFRSEETTHIPIVPLMKEYYSQRASVPGTLLITEATFISAQAGAYSYVPGLWTDEQVAAWRQITDAVHAKGSYIYAQLWALGRTANLNALRAQAGGENLDVVSSSAVALDDQHPTPRPLTEEEIQSFIADYATAARNAVERAGFDGVEIHGANGYLMDQFTQNTVNKRTDKWGGSAENRSRFALEVVRAVTETVGADRTGIRLSPFSTFQGMGMNEHDRMETFGYLAKEIAKHKLAYLHVVEPRVNGNMDVESPEGSLEFFLDAYNDASPLVIAGGYTAESAKEAVEGRYKNHPVVIAFGRYFISNPDLPFKVREGIQFTPYSRDTFYAPQQAKGYIDYPFNEKFTAEAKA